jgi:hypothetical protein
MTICEIKAISLSESASPRKAGEIVRSVLAEIFSIRKGILHRDVLFFWYCSLYSVFVKFWQWWHGQIWIWILRWRVSLYSDEADRDLQFWFWSFFDLLFSARADAELAAFLDSFSRWTKLSHWQFLEYSQALIAVCIARSFLKIGSVVEARHSFQLREFHNLSHIWASPISALLPTFSLASGSRKEGLFYFEIPKGIFVDLETDTNPKYSSKFRNGSVRRRSLHVVYESSSPPIIQNRAHLSRESTIQFWSHQSGRFKVACYQ